MSRTLNKVMLIGNVGKDPELKHTPSGIPVASFNLATTDSWRDRTGTLQEHTDWHSVVAWRGLAEICHKLVKKGTRIYVEGKLQTRKVDDKNGNRKRVVEILIDNMLLLDGKKNKELLSSTDREIDAIEEDFDSFLNFDDDFLSSIDGVDSISEDDSF